MSSGISKIITELKTMCRSNAVAPEFLPLIYNFQFKVYLGMISTTFSSVPIATIDVTKKQWLHRHCA